MINSLNSFCIACVAFIAMTTAGYSDDELKAVEPLSKPYANAMRLVLARAGIHPNYVDVPLRRARNMFLEGAIQIECCIAPLWRAWPNEQDIHTYTDPFYTEVTYLVGAAGSNITVKALSDLKTLRVATIGGFAYEKMENFGSIVGVPNFDDLSRLLLRGRADAVVIGKPEFLW